jgi:hypothetical protein
LNVLASKHTRSSMCDIEQTVGAVRYLRLRRLHP